MTHRPMAVVEAAMVAAAVAAEITEVEDTEVAVAATVEAEGE
jgi:hypothetical protein